MMISLLLFFCTVFARHTVEAKCLNGNHLDDAFQEYVVLSELGMLTGITEYYPHVTSWQNWKDCWDSLPEEIQQENSWKTPLNHHSPYNLRPPFVGRVEKRDLLHRWIRIINSLSEDQQRKIFGKHIGYFQRMLEFIPKENDRNTSSS